jgi:flagellar hook assembly protein FlgD
MLSGVTTARTMEILWDGRDESGSTIASGVYLYQVRVSGADGQTLSASRGFVKIR